MNLYYTVVDPLFPKYKMISTGYAKDTLANANRGASSWHLEPKPKQGNVGANPQPNLLSCKSKQLIKRKGIIGKI